MPTPEAGGSVFGSVYDEDNEPLSGATVTITGSDTSDSAETDDEGNYKFKNLGAGNYTLTYEKNGYDTRTKYITLEAGESLDMGVITLDVQAGSGKLYGYVVNVNGNPIESVKLKLRGVKTKLSKTETTDADGFFEFTELEADTYVLFATKKRYKKYKKSVTVGEGESKEIEIEMRRTTKRIKKLPL